MNDQYIQLILQNAKNIAIVGLSAKENRPSNMVARYLMNAGYHIFPVNPGHDEILGLPCYSSLENISKPIDIVNIFRKSNDTPPIVQRALQLSPLPKLIWLQLGIANDEAKAMAGAVDVPIIMDLCLKIEHKRLWSYLREWNKSSWHNYTAEQQPDWPSKKSVHHVVRKIASLPPLVFAGEIRSLKKQLADAVDGKAFLLQGGDCSENFSNVTAVNIREKLKILLQMAVVLSYAGGVPVLKVGRIAGQFAKPRSSVWESRDGIELPSYRGDMVNRADFTEEARRPDPCNMLQGYNMAASTLNLLRAFTRGGFSSLQRVQAWNQEFVAASPMGKSYVRLAKQIDQALSFMENIGISSELPQIQQTQFYTSHEALLLDYEEALTRQDHISGQWYACSAHLLWIGERTRQVGGAHVEFLRGVHNPIGIKIGPQHDMDDIKQLISILNPKNEKGRITLITRLGKEKIDDLLPLLLREIKREGLHIVWSCDPMHANTYTAHSGHKTRNFVDILAEIRSFFMIHHAEGTCPGGIHLEMTGNNVTECLGGANNIEDTQLADHYETTCDPRLNAEQSLEVAFQIAEMIRI